MMLTNPMIHFSNLRYELEKSRIMIVISVMIAPIRIGMLKSICKAMAPPSISASEVDTEATMADESTERDTHLGVCSVVASDRQSPVAIPKCATLC